MNAEQEALAAALKFNSDFRHKLAMDAEQKRDEDGRFAAAHASAAEHHKSESEATKHKYPETSSLHRQASEAHENARFARTSHNDNGRGGKLFDPKSSSSKALEASKKVGGLPENIQKQFEG